MTASKVGFEKDVFPIELKKNYIHKSERARLDPLIIENHELARSTHPGFPISKITWLNFHTFPELDLFVAAVEAISTFGQYASPIWVVGVFQCTALPDWLPVSFWCSSVHMDMDKTRKNGASLCVNFQRHVQLLVFVQICRCKDLAMICKASARVPAQRH